MLIVGAFFAKKQNLWKGFFQCTNLVEGFALIFWKVLHKKLKARVLSAFCSLTIHLPSSLQYCIFCGSDGTRRSATWYGQALRTFSSMCMILHRLHIVHLLLQRNAGKIWITEPVERFQEAIGAEHGQCTANSHVQPSVGAHRVPSVRAQNTQWQCVLTCTRTAPRRPRVCTRKGASPPTTRTTGRADQASPRSSGPTSR